MYLNSVLIVKNSIIMLIKPFERELHVRLFTSKYYWKNYHKKSVPYQGKFHDHYHFEHQKSSTKATF